MVRLMKQANVFPLKKTFKKFIIWETNSDKGILKEDFQAFSRVPIINKDNGGHTLGISSTKTRVDLQTGQSSKDLTYFRELLSWRRP